MTCLNNFELERSDDEDVVYLKLPGHPGPKSGVVKRTIYIRDLIHDYQGPDINLDFGEGNSLIGIEIIG